jgi:type II secretory pathway pseudopilin PulG
MLVVLIILILAVALLPPTLRVQKARKRLRRKNS